MTSYLPLHSDTEASQQDKKKKKREKESCGALLTCVQSEAVHRAEETGAELIEGGGP